MTIGGTSIITRGYGYIQKIITRGYGGKFQSQGSGKKKSPLYRGLEKKERLEFKIYTPIKFFNSISQYMEIYVNKQITYQLSIIQSILKTLRLYYSIENHVLGVRKMVKDISAKVILHDFITKRIDKAKLIRILKAI